MRFFNVLALASFAMAAPAVKDLQVREVGVIEARQQQQQTAVSTIVSAVNTLQAAVDTNTQAIQTAISETRNSVDAAVIVQLQTAVRANLARIVAAYAAAGATIAGVTTGSAESVRALIEGFSEAQLAEIQAALASAVAALQNLRVIIEASVTGAQPAIRNLVNQELAAINAAFEPFIGPVRNFVTAVQQIRAQGSAGVTGLAGVLASLTETVRRLVASLGLGQVGNVVAGAVNTVTGLLRGGVAV